MIFVVSDIHGQFDTFLKLLEKINFQPQQDKIFCLGDLVDRGPKPLETIRYFKDNEFSIALKGNHEVYLCEYFKYKYEYQFEQHYYYNTAGILEERLTPVDIMEYINWIHNLPLQVELKIDGKLFVLAHGATHHNEKGPFVVDDFVLPEQDWYKERLSSSFEQDYISVVGHTSTNWLSGMCKKVSPGKIYCNEHKNTYFIDCGAAYPEMETAHLAALCLDTLEEFYVEVN